MLSFGGKGSTIDNLDRESPVYWFRRLAAHPNQKRGELAARFRDVVAEYLGLTRPYPHIVWFRPEDPGIATREFDKAVSDNPGRRFDIEDNPFILPCECFRLPQETGEREVICGYTPKDQQQLIGIATECPGGSVLRTIAHECTHVLQDQSRPGWRNDYRDEAEAEADRRADGIRRGFPEWFEAERLACSAPGDSES